VVIIKVLVEDILSRIELALENSDLEEAAHLKSPTPYRLQKQILVCLHRLQLGIVFEVAH